MESYISVPTSKGYLLSLPAEIRSHILEYVFDHNLDQTGFKPITESKIAVVDHDYSVNTLLAPLLTCRQLYLDGHLLAFRRTHFAVTNLYINIPERLSRLSKKQCDALRSMSLVADSRHFRNMRSWGDNAFGLRLDKLAIVLHQTSHHYLFDFTADIAKLLRRLQGVQSVVFVRNQAYVKGAFKTWCNRLIGIILKMDHYERYDAQPPNPEQTWWVWEFDEQAEIFRLDARPSKEMIEEEAYMLQIRPLVEQLMISIEGEEWNPDPRVRNGT